jgi:beta-1,2-mannobiose phosphorylase / 1,2-beta-oligomannan phosphorylase
MLRRLFETRLLCPADLPPSQDDFEVVGTFNPAAARLGDEVMLLVRVAEKPRVRRPGYTALPRWSPTEGMVIDWVADGEITFIDPRVVRSKATGLVRLTFISHIRVVRVGEGKAITSIAGPVFEPESEVEEFGVEDPRLTHLDGRFYFTYVAVSRHGAGTALASTADFQSFTRHGIIFCPENKDVVLFPERIGGKYTALHRPNAATPFSRPEMWVASSTDLLQWGLHEHLWGGISMWESGRIGAGTPPLRTPEGWLEIYHGNQPGACAGDVGIYSAGAMMLDLERPSRVLKRSPECILEPTADFERQGFVPGVFFPTGVVPAGDTLLVYYGAADTCTGVVEISLEELLDTLR